MVREGGKEKEKKKGKERKRKNEGIALVYSRILSADSKCGKRDGV